MSNILPMEIPMSAIPYPLDPLGASGNSPYFEVVLKPGVHSYGFTPYWKTGGYCKVVDWGDGTSEDATASGTMLAHQYAVDTAHTIRIKANCYRVTFGLPTYADDLYDVNGNWDALGDITDGGIHVPSMRRCNTVFFYTSKELSQWTLYVRLVQESSVTCY